jgi:hypothetical protein
MATRIGIGFSQSSDPQEAAYQAATTAKNQLGTPTADSVILFAAGQYGSEILDVIHTVLQPAHLVGTTTGGLIVAEGIFPKGLCVLAINSNEIVFGGASVPVPNEANAHAIGFELARRLNAGFKSHQRQACLIFADPVFQNHPIFIRGIQEVLGLGLPIAGAVSGTLTAPKKDHQFLQKQTLSQSAVGLLIGGTNVGIGHAHGFKPLGKPRTVTKSNNNIIHQIDKKPAYHIYEHFLGLEAEKIKKGSFSLHSSLYPLGIYLEDQKQYLLKNAVDILPDGSIVCQGEVPEDSEVHLMISSRDACQRSATNAALKVKEALGGKQAKLIMIIESFARHNILKSASNIEIQAIRDILGFSTPIVGIYSHSAIAPLGSGRGTGTAHMQNESILIVGID